ncbi:MAG TPA: CDP-alcohol phosphatidyltransferase family protein [Aliidongia sp.]|nr:CDP-alcohol phosphatidyltransferase family protein [Aliidongia sp.]
MTQTSLLPDRRRRGAALALAAGAGLLAGFLLLLGHRIGNTAGLGALFVYGVGAYLLWQQLGTLRDHDFGIANTVTVLRAAMIALLAALIIEARPLDDALGWAVVAGGTVALLLDGVDGQIARRLGRASGFGARFDMEVDAVFVLLLAALAWSAGRAGAWVLLSGAMRYLWVAAAMAWPLLRRPLPPSLFRKSVCVAQIALLLTALAPALAPPWPSALAATGLGLLVLSFGRDFVWLLRGTGMAIGPHPSYVEDAGRV